MPIAPITGKLRKRLWLDLSCAMGLGISSAYAYWSVVLLSFGVVDVSLTLQQQVWLSPEDWLVLGSLVFLLNQSRHFRIF